MAEISITPIPISPEDDVWGAQRNADLQALAAAHNANDGRITTAEADIAGLAEGVIPDLTDAGMASVLASGGEFATEVTAQNFRAVTVTYAGDNVASVTDGPATTTYTYLGDLVDTDSTVIGATTITRQYVYDGAGNLTSIEVI